jgi:pimeloyl-ACP methyl ester carboxylesterase
VPAGWRSWKFRHWLRLAFVLAAILVMLWLTNSMRAPVIEESALRSDRSVTVRDEAEVLALVPARTPGRTALIFICGSAVDAKAYAPLLRPVAESGFAVFVVRLPYRVAPLESHRQIVFDRVRRVIATHPDTANWVVSGHSLGAALAVLLAARGSDPIAGLLLIATTYPRDVDLSGLPIPVTKIYATEDGIAAVDKVLASGRLLPRHTRWVEIAGGNHSQFGRYGEQAFDGEASISREKQEALTRAEIIRLLAEVDKRT